MPFPGGVPRAPRVPRPRSSGSRSHDRDSHAAVTRTTTAGARDLPGKRCVMSAGDTTAKGRGDERHTARKNATRELNY